MAANPHFITVREYLSADYEVDCDYVDGVLEERNVGELEHSYLIGLLVAYFHAHRERLQIKVLPDIRVQVAPTKYRVPDIALVASTETSQILSKAPLLCAEVLSPEDRLSRIRVRTADYHSMGVPDVWIIDPVTRDCYRSTMEGEFYRVADGLLTALEGRLTLRLEELT